MWSTHAAAPLNTAHLGYGIGAVFVNLLVRPFLTQNVNSIGSEANTFPNTTLTSVQSRKANSNIIVPYSITAVLCALIAAAHMFFYIKALRSERERLEIQQVFEENYLDE